MKPPLRAAQNDEEMAQFEGIMNRTHKRSKSKKGKSGKMVKMTLNDKQTALEEIFEDGFEDWVEHDDDHEGHNH